MTLQHQSQRISVCQRHPSATPSPGGFCAPCLRERLECIDPSTLQEIPNYSAPRPESLRRCRSYAAARREIAPPEPSRKSCGARCRDSLSDLFDRDNGRRLPREDFLSDLREEPETEILETRDGVSEDICIDQAFDGFEADVELKSMKEFIDLEVRSKKQKKKDILWVAASAFTHKLRKLRRKDKIKIRGGSVGDVIEAVEDSNARKVRETQSEVGEYGGLGRRSCDTDPRLSLDAGRFSIDDARWSFDKPRASLDGYFHQSHHQNQRFNPMVSFLEDVKVIDSILRNRGAMVEEKLNVVDEERSPGESVQTHDYYKGSSYAQRRRSFDCSNSLKRGTLLEVDELKLMSNAKVSPATTELFYGAKLLTADRRLMDSNTKHSKNESLDSIESFPKVSGSIGETDRKGVKKLQKWGKFWNIWGIKQRKCLDSEKFNGGDLQRLNCASNGSNSGKVAGFIPGSSTSSVEAKDIGTRFKEDSVLQRNQSNRYSPSHIDNGLLRFYLTPLRSYRSKSVKSRLNTVSKVVL